MPHHDSQVTVLVPLSLSLCPCPRSPSTAAESRPSASTTPQTDPPPALYVPNPPTLPPTPLLSIWRIIRSSAMRAPSLLPNFISIPPARRENVLPARARRECLYSATSSLLALRMRVRLAPLSVHLLSHFALGSLFSLRSRLSLLALSFRSRFTLLIPLSVHSSCSLIWLSALASRLSFSPLSRLRVGKSRLRVGKRRVRGKGFRGAERESESERERERERDAQRNSLLRRAGLTEGGRKPE